MPDSLAAIVLGAGAGTRLRPLSQGRPKVLCPVGDRPLVDHNVDRVRDVVGAGVGSIAVNAHHHAPALTEHLADVAHVSVEEGEARGTAGGVARLRGWLDGRPALVVNGDTWTAIELPPLLDGWDGHRVRVMVLGDEPVLRPGVGIIGSVLPSDAVAALPGDRPAGLFESCWLPRLERGQLDVVAAAGPFVACDTPRDYLRANLEWSGGAPVVGAGARVDGEILRTVVWPGAVVHRRERLVDAIRFDDQQTVLVRG
jgi:N-acetyl-alpha-D-muramate 1-phosphate uridylyltransferase